MACGLVLLVQLIFVTFIVNNAVKSSRLADIRENVELANETYGSADGKYEIEIQFNSQQGKSVIQSARKLFKYIKKWKKSYKAEVELAECFVSYLSEKFLRIDLNPCPKNDDEYAESGVYLSKMRFEKRGERSGRPKRELNLIPDISEGNWMHGSDMEEATQWAPHSGENGNVSEWEEKEIKHLLDLLKIKMKSCEFKRAIAQLLHKLYQYLTTFFSKNLLLVCIIKYLSKKFWKWIDSAP